MSKLIVIKDGVSMINSVLGKIDANNLGITLMHEHITWDRSGVESTNKYSVEKVVNIMLPYLLDLKNSGCDTFVDATTLGSGRDIKILIECSNRSGLNILTNIGAWDGSNIEEKFIPSFLKGKSIEEIEDIWTEEFLNGIDGNSVKPAYIKIALGDTGVITEFQEKILRAAARTSIKTKLPIQCHTIPANSAVKAAKIIEDENLPLNKFIWVHGDVEQNLEIAINLAKKGMWVEFDYLGRCIEFNWHLKAIKKFIKNGLLDRLLLSQDAGAFYFGENNYKESILPYDRIFKEFIPYCENNGVSFEVFHKLLIENPIKVLDIDYNVKV
jgi:predicted metal-dependent phosphotriesterase family hydrolase